MIATSGYDGFLYSIGYLAGWIVALFIVAEPMKRLGKYTFTDALDARFNSKGIQFAAAISTLIVSICYLIPQMVGAGVLVEPLLGIPHWAGVIMVGVIVIYIVATAGMKSTTYVQFLKGGLLIIFSTVLVIAVCRRGLETTPPQTLHDSSREEFYEYMTLPVHMENAQYKVDASSGYEVVGNYEAGEHSFLKLQQTPGRYSWWLLHTDPDNMGMSLKETQWVVEGPSKLKYVNGSLTPSLSPSKDLRGVGNLEKIAGKTGEEAKTGPLSPFELIAKVSHPETVLRRWKQKKIQDGGNEVTVIYPVLTSGNEFMRPGQKFKIENVPWLKKIDFISLMMALFFGTAALPHILIRYYTVPSPACARKSTIVAIAAIGFFYVLTMFMGIGAAVNNVVNPLSNNMSAPLLARSFGNLLFAVISAIAFATVLGTVSGLIIAASGAVAHDLMNKFSDMKLSEKSMVLAGKITAIAVGIVAIILGIVFRGMNVSFLVGWAFAVAASANLPAILMLLFWKKTTAKGITSSIIVGIISAVGLILISPSMYTRYGLDPNDALIPFSNPGIFSIPLSFIVLIVVSLMTQKKPVQS